jgi:hypothetical protein
MLIRDVNKLVAGGSLTSARAIALMAKLNAAEQQAQANMPITAGHQLAAFVAQVQVFGSEGFLPQDALPSADHERVAGGRRARRVSARGSAGFASRLRGAAVRELGRG